MPNDSSARTRRCPLCGKPRDEAYKPFCSRGCRDRDLNAWFGEGYRVPVDQAPDGAADGGRQSED